MPLRAGPRLPAQVLVLTTLAMLAFAANSLLCRLALRGGGIGTGIDAASFTTLRLVSGALTLWLIVRLSARGSAAAPAADGNWWSALALFVYAAAFSLAYLSLSAATGALLLFGMVQLTMIAQGLRKGERLRGWPLAGFVLAMAGLVGLLLPGLSAPPLGGSLLMALAGVAWGVYSLRGRGAGDPTRVTAGNFMRSVPFTLALGLLWLLLGQPVHADLPGMLYALASGAVASGLGYAIWYAALPSLNAMSAATVQLSVPAIAAAGGVLLLGESLSLRLVFASVAILGGIALVILARPKT